MDGCINKTIILAVFQIDFQAEFKFCTIFVTSAWNYVPIQKLPCGNTLTFTIIFSICYTKLSPLDIIWIGDCMGLSFVMNETLH